MNADELVTFNHNVYVENENTGTLFNATETNTHVLKNIVQYLYNANFYWMIFQILITICLYLTVRWVDQLHARVKKLEEGPENQPLLATF